MKKASIICLTILLLVSSLGRIFFHGLAAARAAGKQHPPKKS